MKRFNFIFILFFSNHIFANVLKYDHTKSLEVNEQQFIKLMELDCKDYGYQREAGVAGPLEIMQSYPKEIVQLFLNKHKQMWCYYAFSHMAKYLIKDYKNQTEKVVLELAGDCLKSDLKTKPRICNEFNSKAILFDLTYLLGNFCTKKSYKLFRRLNCEFKRIGDNQCKMFQNSARPLERCPFDFSNQKEFLELHKSYFNKKCNSPKWRKLNC